MPKKVLLQLDRTKDRMQKRMPVAVLKKVGAGRWWVQVVSIHESGRFVKVQAGPGFGRARWVGVDDIMFK